MSGPISEPWDARTNAGGKDPAWWEYCERCHRLPPHPLATPHYYDRDWHPFCQPCVLRVDNEPPNSQISDPDAPSSPDLSPDAQ